MNKQVKKEWVKALRSGKYKQCKGALREGNPGAHRYCCLGVLTDLCAKKRKKSFSLYMDSFNETLSDKVKNWAGLDENDPNVYYGCGRVRISTVNDQGTNFNEIADLIEKQL